VIYDLTVQADGKIVAVGQANGDNPLFAAGIAHYFPTGQLDPFFAAGGTDAQTLSTGNGTYQAVCLQPNRGIIAVGTYSDLFSFENSVVFATRYQTQLGTSLDVHDAPTWRVLAQPGGKTYLLEGPALRSVAAVRWARTSA
jgi:hypothetical protein